MKSRYVRSFVLQTKVKFVVETLPLFGCLGLQLAVVKLNKKGQERTVKINTLSFFKIL